MLNPARDRLLDALWARQVLEVRERDSLWAQYFADRAGWIGSVPQSAVLDVNLHPRLSDGHPPARLVNGGPERAIDFLERATLQRNAGAILVMVRSALAALKGSEEAE